MTAPAAPTPPPCPSCDEGRIETCLAHGGANCPCSTVSRECPRCGGDGRARCVECGEAADVARKDDDGRERAYCAACAAATLVQDFGGSA